MSDARKIGNQTINVQLCLVATCNEKTRYSINNTPCPMPKKPTYSRLINPNVTLSIIKKDTPSKTLIIRNNVNTDNPS